MTDTRLKPGDDVIARDVSGTIVDVRATPSGKWIFGVEDTSGAVHYFTGDAVRRAQD